MFEGLEYFGAIDMEFIDTLLIFNFDKGTVKGINREETKNPYRNYIKGFPTESTIKGDFNGDGKIDSLTVENLESLLQQYGDNEIDDGFNFIFSDTTIPKLKVWGCLVYTNLQGSKIANGVSIFKDKIVNVEYGFNDKYVYEESSC